eukprot:COSAG03_NODE_18679_length_350_cov_1.019920_2_plen_49_part_01
MRGLRARFVVMILTFDADPTGYVWSRACRRNTAVHRNQQADTTALSLPE